MRSFADRASAALFLAGAGALTGCVSTDGYYLERERVAAYRDTDGRLGPVVPAIRASDGKQVYLKTRFMTAQGGDVAGTGRLRVQARAASPLITAGSILTWVGTAVSLVGTALFAVGKIEDQGTLFLTGAGLALGAEPLMWSGTALWIVGALRPPYEERLPPPVPNIPPPGPP